jgi:2-haloacid dehalogenase
MPLVLLFQLNSPVLPFFNYYTLCSGKRILFEGGTEDLVQEKEGDRFVKMAFSFMIRVRNLCKEEAAMPDSKFKAFVFDAYGTLFDVHSVIEKCNELFPGKGETISRVWRQKQLEYSFLRQLMGRYTTFLEITGDALRYACKDARAELSQDTEKELIDSYLKLKHYEETEEVLRKLQPYRTAIFSNGSLNMLTPLINQSPFASLLDDVLSVDEVKQFKPTPMSYQLVLENMEVRREEVLFMSSNTWDIAGAASFGFHTAWINRQGKEMDQLGIKPHYEYEDLRGILEHVK